MFYGRRILNFGGEWLGNLGLALKGLGLKGLGWKGKPKVGSAWGSG